MNPEEAEQTGLMSASAQSRPLITHLDSVPQVLPEHKRLLCNLLFFLTVFLLTSIARLIFLGLFLLVRNTNKTTTEKK